jgi:predicted metal-binding membrane protein
MPMPGTGPMSMMWMRMPDQSWLGAAASFVAMWVAMMVPMMLPAVAPVLWRHREAAAISGARRPGALTAVAGAGYVFVWALLGVAVFPLGASVSELVMAEPALRRALPVVIGVAVVIAGAIQLTPWKARRLACCRIESRCHASRAVGAGDAWRDGTRLGLRCVACCGNLMLIPLVIGVMDLSVMAAVGAAIAVERLSPRGERAARVTGVVILATGALLVARAVGL